MSMLVFSNSGAVHHTGGPFCFSVMLPFLILDWRWLTASARVSRVRLLPCITATVIAGLAGVIFESGFTVPLAAMLAGGAAMSV